MLVLWAVRAIGNVVSDVIEIIDLEVINRDAGCQKAGGHQHRGHISHLSVGDEGGEPAGNKYYECLCQSLGKNDQPLFLFLLGALY